MARPPNSRVHYGWIVVAVCIPVIMINAGVRSAPGAWQATMEADTGWSKATLSFSAAVGLVLFGLGGPVAGSFIARFGVRAMAAASLFFSGVSLLLTSQVHSPLQLYVVFGVLSGISTGLVASVLGATVASRWFVTRRGLVIGIFGASTSAGLLVFVKLLNGLGQSQGWRSAAVILAMIAFGALPLVLFIAERPSDRGLDALGAVPGSPPPPAADSAILRTAVRSLDFWLLAGTFFVCGATSNGLIGQHFISHALDHGFTQSYASSALALMGVFNFLGTLASGWLTDRYDPRKLLVGFYGFRALSLFVLPAVHDSLGILAFSVLFGFDYIATVPPTIALCADRFGRQNIALIYGWVFAAHQIGAAASAWITGVSRDALESYDAAFIVAGFIALAAGLLAMRVGAPRRTAVIPVGA